MAAPMIADCRNRPLALLVHILATAVFGYALYWQAINPMPPSIAQKNPQAVEHISRRIFLTYWDNWFQFICFSLFLISDPLSWFFSRSPFIVRILRLRDLYFNGIAFPLGMFVQITFWGIYAFDRELIFPQSIEPWYPQWLNHATHTAMVPFALLELSLVRHSPPKRYIGLGLLLATMAAYLAWTLFLAFKVNFWVYPIMAVLPNYGRAAFISMCMVLVTVIYFVCETINGLFWYTAGRRGAPGPKTGKVGNQSSNGAKRKNKSN